MTKYDPVSGFLMNLCGCGALGYFAIGQKKKALFALIYSIIIFIVLAIIVFIVPEILIFLVWVLILIVALLCLCCCCFCLCCLPWICCIAYYIVQAGCIALTVFLCTCGWITCICIIGCFCLCFALILIVVGCPLLVLWFLINIPLFIIFEMWGLAVIPFIALFTYATWLSAPAGMIFLGPFAMLIIVFLLSGLPFAIDIYILLGKKGKDEEVVEGDSGISFYSILPGFKAAKTE